MGKIDEFEDVAVEELVEFNTLGKAVQFIENRGVVFDRLIILKVRK